MTSPALLHPTTLDPLSLRNRICMASLTRNRCTDANKPTLASIHHYTDRACDGAGLIVAEGTFVYLNGRSGRMRRYVRQESCGGLEEGYGWGAWGWGEDFISAVAPWCFSFLDFDVDVRMI